MKIFTFFCGILLATSAIAQNVGIGTITPNASAQLEVNSTTKGMLLPRMNTSQRSNIANPVKGLLVYDTDLNGLFHYNGSGWSTVGGTGSLSLPFAGSIAQAGTAFAVSNTGDGKAITGSATGSFTAAIEGVSTGTGGYGVVGNNNSAGGYGIYGINATGTAVYGFSANGGTALRGNSPTGLALFTNGNLRLTGGNTNPSEGAVLTSVDANGNAVWQNNRIGFKAYGIASGQSVVPDNTVKRVHFGGEQYDLGNYYNLLPANTSPTSASSTFSVPITGLYHFDVSFILVPNATAQDAEVASADLIIARNGTWFRTSSVKGVRGYNYSIVSDPENAMQFQISSTEHLLAGDKVYVEVYHSTGTSATYRFGENAWFSGYLVMRL